MSVTAGDRRIVSVLVADVAGSTSVAEKIGPERSKFLFDEVVQLMREEVERFGGTVAQLSGDGVLALFGAPTAHEDDSARAVRAALALHESLARYAREVTPAYGIELAARVAVNTGPVVVPQREAPPDVLYNALGDTVNVAARLQSFGDLVVGPATARQVQDSFELEEFGEVELKGKRKRVSAFRVVGVREQPLARVEAPLVGRKQELATLSQILDALLEGRGAIISITGEPGIGKSRLVAEVERSFNGRVRFLAGHAVSYTETIPYWPVRELLRTWLGLGVSDPEARVRLELRAELARTLADGADEAYPFLATLLGLTLEPQQAQRVRDFASDAVQRQTFDWLYQLVCALARERPLCLVLEDLHWSDEATLSLLDDLFSTAEHAPLAFLLVHRSDPDHPAWQVLDRARRRFRGLFFELELEPLSDADARALAETEAGGELPEALGQLLAEGAGGNPYFVGEALRDLRERGALERESGRLVLVEEASIPVALQEALQARLDRLDAEARELVTTAAVIGRSFGLPLLERLLPRARLLPTLSKLQWLQLVVEERSLPAPEYRFRHGLVQEVAYGRLLEARRRELHLQVGEALESIHRDSPAEVYGLLGRHFAEADEPERAIDYLLKAGDAARDVYAGEEAIELYRRALGFMDRIDDARARQTLLKIALTHHLAFDFRAANAAFGEAFARPAPPPTRLEPSERVVWAMPSAWDGEATPGHSYAEPAFEVARNLYRGLVAIGPDFDVEPEIAERFTVSDDGLRYRFTLRPDVLWSDGAPVTAEDFAFTYTQMVEDGVATSSWLDGVSAEAVDEGTLEIRLREPRNDFLYPLAQPPFFPWPRHVYEREGRDWYRAIPLVGNGPFALTSRDKEGVVMAASPTWHGSRGNVGEVVIKLEASPAVAADRWRRGDYDVLHDVLTFRALADEETLVQRSPGMWTWHLGFNSRLAPLDNARVRRAFAHAIDRRGPAELLRSAAATTGGLVPPTIQGHSPRSAPAFDRDRARALLRDAGHGDGRDLEEIVLAYLDLWEDAATDVASQLEAIGVRVRLLSLPRDPDLAAAIKEGVHVFFWAWGGEYPDTGRGFLEPILGEYPSLYRDEELEELLARAASLRDQDERLRTYREFERLWIGEHAAVLPLAYGDVMLWLRPWITGMWVNATEISTFAHAVVTRPDPAGVGRGGLEPPTDGL
jgi:ABC-type transport system substrate-binding protein/class 3 adenylate cyclase